MKTSNLIRVAGVALFTIAIAACSSGQSTSSTGTDRSGVSERGTNIDVGGALNSVSYSPAGAGFPYKSTYVNPADFNSWATKFKPQIEQALNALPSGYKLQVTGHTDSTGPRTGDGVKMGNVYYSTERAKAVHTALLGQGLPADKLTYVGIANDEPLPGEPSDSQKNRRVTFKVVKAQ